MAHRMLCDNTSINTFSLPRPKCAFTPFGNTSVTPGSSTLCICGSTVRISVCCVSVIGATGYVVASDRIFLLQ
ncbi:MAG: hypothetical protein HDS43_00995 [Bacteroides sp.]|nr:hypothetical protein [Bacteroides sp.]